MLLAPEETARTLIAEIRRAAALSQTELARRSGLQRPVLSAYEHGRRQPSVAALARIAGAAGLELSLSVRADEAALTRAGRVLKDVLDLAQALPARRAGDLAYPPLMRLDRPLIWGSR